MPEAAPPAEAEAPAEATATADDQAPQSLDAETAAQPPSDVETPEMTAVSGVPDFGPPGFDDEPAPRDPAAADSGGFPALGDSIGDPPDEPAAPVDAHAEAPTPFGGTSATDDPPQMFDFGGADAGAAVASSDEPLVPPDEGTSVSEVDYSSGDQEPKKPSDTTDSGWVEALTGPHRVAPPEPEGPPPDVGGGGNDSGPSLLDKLKGGSGPSSGNLTAPEAPPGLDDLGDSGPVPPAGPAVGAPPAPFIGGDDVNAAGEDPSFIGSGPESAFGNDEEEPPTEEVPSAVLQDLSQLYNAPMDMPQAPMPGLFDGDDGLGPMGGMSGPGPTPAQGNDSDLPSYAEDFPTEEAAQPHQTRRELPKTNPPVEPISYDADDDYDDDEDWDDDEDSAPFGLSRGAFLGLMGIVSVVATVVIAGAALALLSMGGVAGTADIGPELNDRPPVEAPPPTPTGLEDGSGSVAEDGTGSAEGSAEGSGSEVAVEAPPDPPPVKKKVPVTKVKAPVVTKVKKVTKPPVEPPPEPGGKGTLKVRSNKRVLVMVDGRPVDFSPVELPLEAGTHTISAMQPGRRDTKQDKEVTVKAGKVADVEFNF